MSYNFNVGRPMPVFLPILKSICPMMKPFLAEWMAEAPFLTLSECNGFPKAIAQLYYFTCNSLSEGDYCKMSDGQYWITVRLGPEEEYLYGK